MAKRMLSIATVVAALMASGGAGAGVSERSVSAPYERPTGLVTADPTRMEAIATVGLDDRSFRAKPGESAVSVVIVDDAGGTPHGDLHLDQDRDGRVDVHKSFCGSTTKPVRIRPRAIVSVLVFAGQCHDGSPAIATRGTVEITFHK